MKICILGNAQSPHIRRWAKFFTARGREVTIVSSRPGELDGVRIHVPNLPFEARLRRRQSFDEDRTPNFAVYLSYFILALTIRSVLKRLSPDIVMAMTMETNGVLSMISGHHPTALFPLGHKALSIASEKSLVVRLLVKAMIRFADMLSTLDRHLADNEYMAGEYSVADISMYPDTHVHGVGDIGLDAYPNLLRWHDSIAARPAVVRAWEPFS